MPLVSGRLPTAPRVPLSVAAFRNQAPKYDSLSGEGARIHGGRFNPPGSFPVLYLCETRPCVVAEFERQAAKNVVGVDGLLPRVLYRYELQLDRVLDLTDVAVREHIGVSIDDLMKEDWTTCQAIGTDAHDLGDQAVRSFSATGVDVVLAVFPESLGAGLISVDLDERWHTAADL